MKITRLILCVFLCVIVGSVSGFFTVGEIEGWYATLNKPGLNPPNWIFGPVWTLLYIMMGVALYFFWITKSEKNKRSGYVLFYIQLALNFLWSLFFFKMHNPIIALVDIVLLIITILTTMFLFRKISVNAFYLLIPYLLWVCFATWLNYQIIQLNPGI
ncbi:MAG: tryptophan-rich sensory protein [Chitinophagales bacterium]|nr:tryptophan-rich sensory protein [Bacteroidota bacterium]MBP7399095.1 tryptophan-rich sensory protein [Chitinophagales bacterium]MBK8487062.1 tryptophan-rich sensory protein [Bacteroidota bacterium]MBK8680451.1 tryptophan-rich sensory protein [Bacteroidota bacterium]MBP8754056.1 tryptophan-rich sensory protein [Chitinophagales bacterium]